MGAIRDFFKTQKQWMREDFNEAFAKGKRYLLAVDVAMPDYDECVTLTYSVNKPCEIVPMLRQIANKNNQDETSSKQFYELLHVFDLQKDRETQIAQMGKGFRNVLGEEIIKEIAAWQDEQYDSYHQWEKDTSLFSLFSGRKQQQSAANKNAINGPM